MTAIVEADMTGRRSESRLSEPVVVRECSEQRTGGEGPVAVTGVGVPGGHATHDIALALLASRADVSGNYTMTITAAGNCGVGLGEGRVPEEARVRSYQAAVKQDGPALFVTLDEPKLAFGRTGFPGRVEPGRVVFNLSWQDGEEPDPHRSAPNIEFLSRPWKRDCHRYNEPAGRLAVRSVPDIRELECVGARNFIVLLGKSSFLLAR